MAEQENTTPKPAAPAWYTRKGFPLWLAILIPVLILSTVLLTPRDAPARIGIMAASFLSAVGLYFYTHGEDEKAKAARLAAERKALEDQAVARRSL